VRFVKRQNVQLRLRSEHLRSPSRISRSRMCCSASADHGVAPGGWNHQRQRQLGLSAHACSTRSSMVRYAAACAAAPKTPNARMPAYAFAELRLAGRRACSRSPQRTHCLHVTADEYMLVRPQQQVGNAAPAASCCVVRCLRKTVSVAHSNEEVAI
jgi:hypothetical protein